jgi:F-type H+-transporting ATPase subunit a
LIPGVSSIGYYHHGEAVEESGEHALNLDGQLAMADGNLAFIGPLAQAATPESGESEDEVTADEHGPKFVPLFRAPSTDLNMTFALAITTMVMVQVWGMRAQGGAYFAKFVNTSGPNVGMRIISGFVSFLEIISEFSRIIAFGFRLFGNIFAGEVVLGTMAFLIPLFLPLPFYVLEVGVGVIQALVFMMLALVFFTIATISHGHEEHGAQDAATHHEEDVNVMPGTLAPEGSH